MADTLRYSIQGSPLAPSGFIGNYGRLQVDLRPALNTIVISSTDYDNIALALSEGRSINLKDDTGRFLGQFATALAGGFNIDTFTQATKSDARISFKPSQELLKSARETMTFEQVPTVINSPQIKDINFTYDVAGVQTTIYNSISQGNSGLLSITGINFVKDDCGVRILQLNSSTGIVTVDRLANPVKQGAKYLDVMLTSTTLSSFLPSSDPNVTYTRLKVFRLNRLDDDPLYGEKNITLV